MFSNLPMALSASTREAVWQAAFILGYFIPHYILSTAHTALRGQACSTPNHL